MFWPEYYLEPFIHWAWLLEKNGLSHKLRDYERKTKYKINKGDRGVNLGPFNGPLDTNSKIFKIAR